MFSTKRAVADHETRIAALALAVAEIKNTIATTSPSALRARVDELEAEIEALRGSVRKQFGQVWHKFRGEPTSSNGAVGSAEPDAELAAFLKLQSASTPK